MDILNHVRNERIKQGLVVLATYRVPETGEQRVDQELSFATQEQLDDAISSIEQMGGTHHFPES